MTSYWTTDYLKRAFEGIKSTNPSLIISDFPSYWGHKGSTIKIKIMNEMFKLCSGNTSLKTEIFDDLAKMLKECEIYKDCILTSPSHNKLTPHHNDKFQFFDFDKMKIMDIEEFNIESELETLYKSGEYTMSHLIHSIKNKNANYVLNLINTDNELFPDFIYKNDSALTVACRLGKTDIVYSLINRFGKQCLPFNGTEVFLALKYKMPSPALTILELFSDEQFNMKNGDASILMTAISYCLEDFSNKMIDLYGIKCSPDYKTSFGLTALNLACNESLETVAINLITTFGPDKCNLEYKDNYGFTALDKAKKNNLTKFLETLNIQGQILAVDLKPTYNNMEDSIIIKDRLGEFDKLSLKKVNVQVYYKGIIITNLNEAINHYKTLITKDSSDRDDFKRVIKLFIY